MVTLKNFSSCKILRFVLSSNSVNNKYKIKDIAHLIFSELGEQVILIHTVQCITTHFMLSVDYDN